MHRVRFTSWPLRAKLAGFLLVVSLLPVAVLAVLEVHEARTRIFEDETQLLAARADQLVGEMDGFHRGHQRAVARLAAIPEVIELLGAIPDDVERLRGEIAGRLRVHEAVDPAIRGIGIVDGGARVIAATEPA